MRATQGAKAYAMTIVDLLTRPEYFSAYALERRLTLRVNRR